jgi:hypothetical protein
MALKKLLIMLPLVLALLSGLVWMVRLEGRVDGHDKQIHAVEDHIKYVRDRIDRALERRP